MTMFGNAKPYKFLNITVLLDVSKKITIMTGARLNEIVVSHLTVTIF